MFRSLFVCLVLVAAIAMSAQGGVAASCNDHPDYAESAMLSAISIDGRQELALRMARHPNRGTGTLWMHLAIDEVVYSTVVEQIPLRDDATCASAGGPWSEFRLHEAVLRRGVESQQALEAVAIGLEADLKAMASRHPEPGRGDHPVTLSLEFRPDGREFRVHDGTRREAYGEVAGVVTTPEQTWELTLPANWHEQTGPRPGFAPSFTYLNLQNDETALLAIKYAQGVVGYLIDGDGQRSVTGLEIDPAGSDTRQFRIEAEGGDDVTGTASVTQRWSVPIEGKRRPGSGVVADSSIGPLAGSLNDWEAPSNGAAAAASATPADRFLRALASHCGNAYPGALAIEPEGDTMLSGEELLLAHFRDCADGELRIPFHIEADAPGGWDSSRTWYVMRTDSGLELRHDHRLADGSEDSRTWYGGFTATEGTAMRQDFVSPERTAAAGVPVGWRIEIEPGVAYRYGTTYEGEYDWMVAFDLTEPYDGSIPDAWGHTSPPSRIPGPP